MIIEHISKPKVITHFTISEDVPKSKVEDVDVDGPKGWATEYHEDGTVIYKNPAARRY